MEQENQEVYQQTASQTQGVGFPQVKPKSKFPLKWIIAVVGTILILVVGGYFVLNGSQGGTTTGPTPEGNSLSSFPTGTPTIAPTPALTPTPKAVSKSEIKVEVLNGTGKSGEASFLKTKLQDLGYTDVSAANAESQSETRTTVTFGDDIGDDVIKEISDFLEKTYESVRTKRGGLDAGNSIRILTGPRLSSETSPTQSPSSSPSPSASPSNEE